MRTDQADICARSQSASPRLEDAAEREWARLERLLSSDSAAGSAGQLRCFARPPKRQIATLGFPGSLRVVSVFAFTLVVPSLGVSTQDKSATPPVSPVVATQTLPVATNSLPEVQTGRSTAIAETPQAPSPIAAPRLKPRPELPTKERQAVTVTPTPHKRQIRSAVSTNKPREAAVRPIGRTEDRWYRVPAWRYQTLRYQASRSQTWRY